MSSYRDVLERVGDRAQMPEPAFDRMLRRRDKKRRNQRISAGVVGLTVLLALVLGLTQVSANRSPSPLKVPKRLPSNGWIVYTAQPENQTDGPGASSYIYLAGEGIPARRIVGSHDDGLGRTCPTFSPDGARLAYGEYATPMASSGVATLVVTALDASGDPTGAEQRIAAPTILQPNLLCAEWSPDGRRLAYTDDAGLWVAALNGQILQLLSDGHVRDFEWSPDGSKIAVLMGGEIWLVSSIGGKDVRVGSPDMAGGKLAWAPDGTRIALGSQVIDVVRNVVRTLDLGGDDPTKGDNPAWSPDGEEIAFVKNDRIVLADPDGSGSITLPPVDLPALSKGHVGLFPVQWSPDGKRLLSIGWTGNPHLTYAVISIPVEEKSSPVLVSPVTLGLYFTTPRDLDWQAVPS